MFITTTNQNMQMDVCFVGITNAHMSKAGMRLLKKHAIFGQTSSPYMKVVKVKLW